MSWPIDHLIRLGLRHNVPEIWERILGRLDATDLVAVYEAYPEAAIRRNILSYIKSGKHFDLTEWTNLYMIATARQYDLIIEIMEQNVTALLNQANANRRDLIRFRANFSQNADILKSLNEHVRNLLEANELTFTARESTVLDDIDYIVAFQRQLENCTHFHYTVEDQSDTPTNVKTHRSLILYEWKNVWFGYLLKKKLKITIEDRRTEEQIRRAAAVDGDLHYWQLYQQVTIFKDCAIMKMVFDCYLVDPDDIDMFRRAITRPDCLRQKLTIKYNAQKVRPAAWKQVFDQFVNDFQGHPLLKIKQL